MGHTSDWGTYAHPRTLIHFTTLTPTMATATKMPRYFVLLQRAHRLFWVLGGMYVLLLVLGGTPFMQRQYVCHF